MRICNHDNCNNKHDSHGYCANHARQYRKYGHVLTDDEKTAMRKERASRTQKAFYENNPDRPKRLWSKEARERAKGRVLNTGKTHFKKGMKAWNRGIKVPSMAGENNPNWKGGVTSERHKEMTTAKYKEWRNGVFERDDYTCQICLIRGGVLHADHIVRWADNEELRYAVNNGRTLCVPCHYYVTFKRKMEVGTLWCNYKMTGLRG